MDKKNIIERLSKKSMLKALERTSLEKLLEHAEVVEYGEGEPIIRENEINPNIFFIVTGTINIDINTTDRDIYICSMGEGEFIGEAGIFTSLKRSANATAGSDSTLLKFPRQQFHDFIRERPAAGIQVLLIIIYSLLKKLMTVNHELAFERQFDINQDDIDDIIKSFV